MMKQNSPRRYPSKDGKPARAMPRIRAHRHDPGTHDPGTHAHDTHGHAHEHEHRHDDAHDHEHHHHEPQAAGSRDILVVRPTSGLSGDMLLAGLARMAKATDAELGDVAASIGLPGDCVTVEPRVLNDVRGWGCRIVLPHEHSHRTMADIRRIIAGSGLTASAKSLATRAFELLAVAEGRVHGVSPEAVTFHEVGALDSILDTCLCAALYDRISAVEFVCGPLPLCDGVVRCDHGLLPVPAPAVLELLEGVPVRGIDTFGETVTPTAIALLKALGAVFGPWPAMTVRERALVYGGHVLPGVANGAIFALGRASSESVNRQSLQEVSS